MDQHKAHQWIFDRVWQRAQCEKRALSVARPQLCAYRVDGDAYNMAPENVCGIGACIEPQYYSPEIENVLIRPLLEGNREDGTPPFDLGPELAAADPNFLTDLQHVHDNPIEWTERFDKLRKYGERYFLKVPA